jgi:microcystin-dependent protein
MIEPGQPALREESAMAWIFAAFRRLLRVLGLSNPAPAARPAPAPTAIAPPAGRGAEVPMLDAAAPASSPATLAMPQLMALSGQYPTRGDGGTNAYFTQAMVQTFSAFGGAYGAPRSEGQLLQISNPPTNQALFSLLGTSYGGDAIRTFGLPNLDGRVAIGGQQVGMMGQFTLTMTWMISTGPSTLAPEPGTIAMFAPNWASDGWMICDGSELAIGQHVPLFEAIGSNFGGNGQTVFFIPNLIGAAPVGAGQGPGLPPVAVGQQIPGPVAGLGVNYLISLEGPSPPETGPGAFPDTGQYLGQVIAYGGAQAPPGWALCDGSLMDISANQQLFQLIGTTWGGDGKTSFALPDLRGRMVAGLRG